ncbi:TonB-dependent receptor [Aestuariibacter sp. GS-14]|uniref:TonB-dependent receptor plug domain-containing protein n=1 Tax=Aestuariibacter sp. GS-14 TaxID=2590670 RepID=UPI00112A99E2|nr:TonB-dependent receptor [Aestuariibacter sp. GS-14]TPV61821.1 TonB-dependent receptor [Aestuariibacter sp. GS-14]
MILVTSGSVAPVNSYAQTSQGVNSQLTAQRYSFSIRSQTADKALIQVATQAKTTLLFPYELAQKIVLPGVEGLYTLEEVLQLLLNDTPLALNLDDNGFLTIIQRVEQSNTVESADAPDTALITPVEEKLPQFERISVLGTRASARGAYESAVPLDIIALDQPFFQGSQNMLDALTQTVPSLNVNAQTTNDAAMLVRPANLRGLASDHTLTLLNGKRRHRSAVITFLGGGLSDGAQGPDISVLPVSAIEQVEVLRDGAAAQYGSDAIAGVMNFKLKSAPESGSFTLTSGQYSAGDGEMIGVQYSQGIGFQNGGFLHVSSEFQQQQPTSRSVQRSDAQNLIDAGNTFIASPAQQWGSADMDSDIKLALNTAIPLSNGKEWYSFALGTLREMEGEFYFRHPQSRQGVFVTDNINGQRALLVADLDGIGQGIECPSVNVTGENLLTSSAYLQISDPGTEIGRNCFAFNEWFPGGFTPRFGGKVKDATWYTGIRGDLGNDWFYDISAGVGYSGIQYYIDNTVNPSLGPDSPTSFNPGGAAQLEKNASLDLVKEVNAQLHQPVTLAMGIEWRSELYKQIQGEEASYLVGPFAQNVTGVNSGFSVGANGFPGYRPETSGQWQRNNRAIYVDATIPFSQAWLFGAAIRAEDFSDFGTHLDGKFSARWQFSQNMALRSSVSSGYKAPTVGQSNIINISTKFGLNGLEDQVTLPPSNPVAELLGASALAPEESTNLSIGLVAKVASVAQFTLDFYQIRLTDRISTTSAIPLSEVTIELLLAQGFKEAETYRSAKYFTNDFDTLTRGMDMIFHWRFPLGNWQNDLLASINWTDTQVTRVSLHQTASNNDIANLTRQRIRMLEDNLPAWRANITMNQQLGPTELSWRLNYYGGFYEDHLDAAAGLDIETGGRFTLDARWQYALDPKWSMTIGVNNVFNTQPDINPYRFVAGAKYPSTSPGGIDGSYYFAALNAKW